MSRSVITRGDVPDCLWPTDNSFGIPLLDRRYEGNFVDLPVTRWGSTRRHQVMSGTWHFYTDDYRFSALWSDPSPVVNSQCVSAVEPNFSTGIDTPFAVAIWKTYQKRYLARYWQSQGIRIFVDLNVETRYAALNLIGVPVGWRAYMTRGYPDALEELSTQYCTAVQRAQSEEIVFAVFGGGKIVEAWCRRHGAIHLQEETVLEKQRAREAG